MGGGGFACVRGGECVAALEILCSDEVVRRLSKDGESGRALSINGRESRVRDGRKQSSMKTHVDEEIGRVFPAIH
jgi:hypothetical protein